MSDPFSNYHYSATDWRRTLKRNNRRTYIVISLFFLIYAGIGLLIDLYLNASLYPNVAIPDLLIALLDFQIFPLVTLIMIGIAGVSLFISYIFYDKLMLLGTNYHEILPDQTQNNEEKQLYNVVEEMKIAAGLSYMPRVFIIEADYMNAFASGYSEKSAMIAITRGLINKLNRDELQAVMAHELSHIRHLDIKLILTASLLTNLTIIVLDIFFYNALFNSRRRNGNSRQSLATLIIILRYILPVINLLLLLYLSRTRELMADAGSVELMRSNQPLASALLKIHEDHATHSDQYRNEYRNTPHENVRRQAYIFDPLQAGIGSVASASDLFSTHPNLDTRLRALGFKKRERTN